MTGFKLWWIKGTFATLMLLIPGNLAWGKEGHYATCKIAEKKRSEILLPSFGYSATHPPINFTCTTRKKQQDHTGKGITEEGNI
ncbi:hypothetical protein Ccrd_020778 [Cynara cardunculus var. scolymus]|uniref:Uncharacterized protein n=1 Tax=Cynara cardunculus var. scolymus TaxID=59895 RepID=A0A103Y1V6_CYNCS|nr:hypothetical protein Ccrd_020778 [Cynara cardunculus var. scolymus]